MANPEHLAILRQGVEVWNQWREENPDIQPDFMEAELFNEDLRGADLSKARMFKAILPGVNLSKANLHGAFLSNANLRRVKFDRADLSSADFTDADLRKASLLDSNLRYAHLEGVNFHEANLQGSDLNFAFVAYTIFGDVDFKNTVGFETIQHRSASSIDIHTLYRSQGNIPESFLRGCGVPDQMIEYARSLTTTPIQYYSCFISYSHKDEELAQRIHNDLQASGVRCWFAPHDLKIGDKIRPVIDESIRFHDKLLLILSEHSVQSDWVEHEVEHALDRERIEKKNILFPVRLDESVMDSTTGWAGIIRRQRLIGDFSRWKDHDSYMRAFARLLRDLKAEK